MGPVFSKERMPGSFLLAKNLCIKAKPLFTIDKIEKEEYNIKLVNGKPCANLGGLSNHSVMNFMVVSCHLQSSVPVNSTK